MLKIGNIELNNNIILGPMAGLTDRPFRIICEKFNPGLVCTEMVSSKALFYNDEKTKRLLNTQGEKHPIAVQIFGNNIDAIKFSIKYLCENKIADIIDINMGCPAPKIVKNGEGSKLLQDLGLIEKIVNAAVETSNVPVTIKIRKGWDEEHIVAIEVAKIAESAGISAITIHGRTRSQFYSGKADWDIIKKVKENVNIPVIGNGDVVTPESAKKMLDETKCDGVMISRGSLGNPWIFEQTNEYIKTGRYRKINNNEKKQILLEHISLEVEEKGEDVGVREMRKHICFYIKGEKNASEFRNKVNHIENKSELEKEINTYFDNL